MKNNSVFIYRCRHCVELLGRGEATVQSESPGSARSIPRDWEV